MKANTGFEEWRPVVGYELHYEVSSYGRVRSLRRVDQLGHVRNRKFMSQSLSKGIYPRVTLTRDGVEKSIKVHRIVLEAFVGECPEGLEGCHNDGDPKNSALSNLRWDTHKANIADACLHGTMAAGERHYASKISSAGVERIFKLRRDGMTLREIGEKVGLRSTGHISAILRGEKWKRLWREKAAKESQGGVYVPRVAV